MQSRYRIRNRRRRQNLFLNSMIAIVFVLILLVGANIFFGPSSQETESDEEDQSLSEEGSLVTSTNSTQVETGESEAGELERDQDDAEKAAVLHKEEDEHNLNNEASDEVYQFVGGGPEGPWEPIGTKQTGEHVATYEGLDFEEMKLAVAYGAGLMDEEKTFWWIGNGGSPQRAIGRVSSKLDPDTIYIVTIEWIDGKGWKPTQVEIEKR